ncbi:DUF5710 domain-containing protein [Burkholderia vietnamiensis]|nr:DUF5710 domain-containing protein [Burkholderia vietnamiensis]MCA8228388.1 DUF5710 domain-containing protein [Burkholderia vietnamiensis]
MKARFGIDFHENKRGKTQYIEWDSRTAVNPHMLFVGMSGAGKTHNLKKLIRSMTDTVALDRDLRVHVFDVHGDIEIDGASTVMFSQQTDYGFNPLRVNPDPHFGGPERQIQGLIDTLNKVMRQLGNKQEACLRNILMDLYTAHGFDQKKSETWRIDEEEQVRFGNNPDRLYLDIPRWEKDKAKAVANVRWDGDLYCWYIAPDEYVGAITRWPLKRLGRKQPSIQDALTYARRILVQSWMGADEEAITQLEIFNRATQNYQKKVLDAMRRGEQLEDDDPLLADLEKKKQAAIEAYTKYVESIKTGREIDTVMKYDSTDVLKSVVDRLENLAGMRVFNEAPPPFDPQNPVWRYKFNALSLPGRKLAGLVRMEEIFLRAIERGEQEDVVEVIVLDEAHIYGDEEGSILDKIAKEGRKFGLMLVCASQSPIDFTDGFITSCGTKVILGIDESYFRQSATKMRVTEEALQWIRLQKTLLVQVKQKGDAKNDWKYTLIANE